MLLFLF